MPVSGADGDALLRRFTLSSGGLAAGAVSTWTLTMVSGRALSGQCLLETTGDRDGSTAEFSKHQGLAKGRGLSRHSGARPSLITRSRSLDFRTIAGATGLDARDMLSMGRF